MTNVAHVHLQFGAERGPFLTKAVPFKVEHFRLYVFWRSRWRRVKEYKKVPGLLAGKYTVVDREKVDVSVSWK